MESTSVGVCERGWEGWFTKDNKLTFQVVGLVCSLSWLWWWPHGCIYMSELISVVLVYANHILIKLFWEKASNNIWLTYLLKSCLGVHRIPVVVTSCTSVPLCPACSKPLSCLWHPHPTDWSGTSAHRWLYWGRAANQAAPSISLLASFEMEILRERASILGMLGHIPSSLWTRKTDEACLWKKEGRSQNQRERGCGALPRA